MPKINERCVCFDGSRERKTAVPIGAPYSLRVGCLHIQQYICHTMAAALWSHTNRIKALQSRFGEHDKWKTPAS